MPRLRPQRYFALNGLDRRLEKYIDYDDGYFVELGANDGVTQSNTLYFERFRGWKGVLIEPTPHNFFKCKANRSTLNSVHCAACVSFDYKDPFVRMLYSNLMTTTGDLDSDIADATSHAQGGVKFLSSREEVVTFGALARPLNDILIQAGAPDVIDLLSLDVEGVEIEVLKGVDHDRFKFRHILVECRDLPTMRAYLQGQGYELIEKISEHDYIFDAIGLPA
ncbi:FkbM family methyltransferase [Rhizobacter sp. Root404]|nr:FkbM family methyltransferase [Rhizobacter sp. Root404]